MRKWAKIGKLTTSLIQSIATIDKEITLLIITEGWCGDAAQNLPFVHKMAMLNPKINIRVILRDEHPTVIDQFLTNSGRSIPKVIALDTCSLNVLGDWGPRPSPIQNEFLENRKSHAKTGAEFAEHMHFWYAKDKGMTLQSEFLAIFDAWKIKQQSLQVQAG
jgi:hypothetical protein